MIISSASAKRLIENVFFKQIINDFTNQKLMDRKSLDRLEENYYISQKAEIKKKLKSVDYISSTIDCWTSKIVKKSFLSITLHYLEEWQSKFIELGIYNIVGAHTADVLASKVQGIFKYYKIDEKIISLVTDNAKI